MKNPTAPAFWWALSWELDRSVSSVALGVFGAMRARGAIALWLAGSRKRDPSVVWDYFKADTAQDVTCSDRLGGGRIRERGRCVQRVCLTLPPTCYTFVCGQHKSTSASLPHLLCMCVQGSSLNDIEIFLGERRVKHLFVCFLVSFATTESPTQLMKVSSYPLLCS